MAPSNDLNRCRLKDYGLMMSFHATPPDRIFSIFDELKDHYARFRDPLFLTCKEYEEKSKRPRTKDFKEKKREFEKFFYHPFFAFLFGPFDAMSMALVDHYELSMFLHPPSSSSLQVAFHAVPQNFPSKSQIKVFSEQCPALAGFDPRLREKHITETVKSVFVSPLSMFGNELFPTQDFTEHLISKLQAHGLLKKELPGLPEKYPLNKQVHYMLHTVFKPIPYPELSKPKPPSDSQLGKLFDLMQSADFIEPGSSLALYKDVVTAVYVKSIDDLKNEKRNEPIHRQRKRLANEMPLIAIVKIKLNAVLLLTFGASLVRRINRAMRALLHTYRDEDDGSLRYNPLECDLKVKVTALEPMGWSELSLCLISNNYEDLAAAILRIREAKLSDLIIEPDPEATGKEAENESILKQAAYQLKEPWFPTDLSSFPLLRLFHGDRNKAEILFSTFLLEALANPAFADLASGGFRHEYPHVYARRTTSDEPLYQDAPLGLYFRELCHLFGVPDKDGKHDNPNLRGEIESAIKDYLAQSKTNPPKSLLSFLRPVFERPTMDDPPSPHDWEDNEKKNLEREQRNYLGRCYHAVLSRILAHFDELPPFLANETWKQHLAGYDKTVEDIIKEMHLAVDSNAKDINLISITHSFFGVGRTFMETLRDFCFQRGDFEDLNSKDEAKRAQAEQAKTELLASLDNINGFVLPSIGFNARPGKLNALYNKLNELAYDLININAATDENSSFNDKPHLRRLLNDLKNQPIPVPEDFGEGKYILVEPGKTDMNLQFSWFKESSKDWIFNPRAPIPTRLFLLLLMASMTTLAKQEDSEASPASVPKNYRAFALEIYRQRSSLGVLVETKKTPVTFMDPKKRADETKNVMNPNFQLLELLRLGELYDLYLKSNIRKLGIPKHLKNELRLMLGVYDSIITDPIQFDAILELGPSLVRSLKYIQECMDTKTPGKKILLESKKQEKLIEDIEFSLRRLRDGFSNRYSSSFALTELSDVTLEVKGPIQHLLTSLDGILASALQDLPNFVDHADPLDWPMRSGFAVIGEKTSVTTLLPIGSITRQNMVEMYQAEHVMTLYHEALHTLLVMSEFDPLRELLKHYSNGTFGSNIEYENRTPILEEIMSDCLLAERVFFPELGDLLSDPNEEQKNDRANRFKESNRHFLRWLSFNFLQIGTSSDPTLQELEKDFYRRARFFARLIFAMNLDEEDQLDLADKDYFKTWEERFHSPMRMANYFLPKLSGFKDELSAHIPPSALSEETLKNKNGVGWKFWVLLHQKFQHLVLAPEGLLKLEYEHQVQLFEKLKENFDIEQDIASQDEHLRKKFETRLEKIKCLLQNFVNKAHDDLPPPMLHFLLTMKYLLWGFRSYDTHENLPLVGADRWETLSKEDFIDYRQNRLAAFTLDPIRDPDYLGPLDGSPSIKDIDCQFSRGYGFISKVFSQYLEHLFDPPINKGENKDWPRTPFKRLGRAETDCSPEFEEGDPPLLADPAGGSFTPDFEYRRLYFGAGEVCMFSLWDYGLFARRRKLLNLLLRPFVKAQSGDYKEFLGEDKKVEEVREV